MTLPPGIEPWLPVLSGDGKWMAAMQLSGTVFTPSGLAVSQIVVFPR